MDEALLLDAILSSLRLKASLGPLLTTQLEALKRASDHTPVDWWLCCALSSGAKSRAASAAKGAADCCSAMRVLMTAAMASAPIGAPCAADDAEALIVATFLMMLEIHYRNIFVVVLFVILFPCLFLDYSLFHM